MARQELIVEFEKDLLRELEDTGKLLGRSPQIIIEIRKLLGYPNDAPTASIITNSRNKKESIKGEGIPKGKDMSWESYVQTILKELGGKGKTKDVGEYAIKANPRINADLVLTAVRGKLSKLKLNSTIGAHETSSKKDGYEFFILEKDKKDGTGANTISLNDILHMAKK